MSSMNELDLHQGSDGKLTMKSLEELVTKTNQGEAGCPG